MDRKEEMTAAARALAERLGAPTLRLATFLHETRFHTSQVYADFASWPELCAAAGIRACRRNRRDTEADIFAAMRDAFTEAGGVCTRAEFVRLSGVGEGVLNNRLGTWRRALEGFRRWATENAPDFPHFDAVDTRLGWLASAHRREPDTPTWPAGDGRAAGDPLGFRAMMFAPANEAGVVLLFGMVAQDLGYAVETVAPGFPDCTAKRRTGAGRWEAVRIEFEYRSRNFREHGHDAAGCDLVVCWEHDWPACPLEVLALRPAIAGLARG